MIGLNKLFKKVNTVRGRYLEKFPGNKSQINDIFNSILEIFERMNYERKRGNTKRFEFTSKDVPIESLLMLINKELKNPKPVHQNEVINFLVKLDVNLQNSLWDIQTARRCIKSLLINLE